MPPAQTKLQSKSSGAEETNKEITFALLSDTHFGLEACREKRAFAFDAHRRTRTILEAISQDAAFDFVIHVGDVIDRAKIGEYPKFDAIRSSLFPETPWYYAAGNHDKPSVMADALGMGPREDLFDPHNQLHYTFSRGPHHFIIIDGVDTADHSKAEVGREGLEWLRGCLENIPQGHFAWPICHFPLRRFSEKIPERMILEDGEELNKVLLDHRDRIGFFSHGHIHIGVAYAFSQGPNILNNSIPSSSFGFSPLEGGFDSDPSVMIGYQVVRVDGSGGWSIEIKNVDVSASLLS